MGELSLDNGIHFVNLDNLSEKDKEKIDTYWDELVSFMDYEDREETNNFTESDTDLLEGKIQYLKDYLSISKYDLILG